MVLPQLLLTFRSDTLYSTRDKFIMTTGDLYPRHVVFDRFQPVAFTA